MRLVTFQTMDALKSLIINGNLVCDEKYIDVKKVGYAYQWIVEKMNQYIPNKMKVRYPLWCWVKCYNSICPPKHKGEAVKEFQVKIVFRKKENEVFITDFRRYSFLLNNVYIPNTLKEKEEFDRKLRKLGITQEDLKKFVRTDKYEDCRTDENFLKICKEIRDTFDRCITTNSNVLQGCVWNIKLSEIESIEFLSDDGYRYGSLNYKQSNGKRKNWQEDFYKLLK